jgi:hypothetical protein
MGEWLVSFDTLRKFVTSTMVDRLPIEGFGVFSSLTGLPIGIEPQNG